MHNHLKWIVTFEKYKILHEKKSVNCTYTYDGQYRDVICSLTSSYMSTPLLSLLLRGS